MHQLRDVGRAGPGVDAAADAAVDALLVRVGTGDPDAFAGVYDATSAVAFQLAKCLDPADAEELLRVSYLEVWRTSSRFDPNRMRAVPWILGVVRACARSSVAVA